jgi:probable phosphoglycerate mutase
MLKIVLIRPGSTEFDKQGRIQGCLDIPLSNEGKQEVAEVIDGLHDLGIQCVYASPSESATETAHAIAASLDVKCKTLDKMRNLDQGLWQGMLVDDVKKKQPKVYRQWQENPESICPPEGEMLGAVKLRAANVINRLLKKHKDGIIGLIVPEPLASVVRDLISDQGLGNLWKASDCGSWEALVVDPALVGAK